MDTKPAKKRMGRPPGGVGKGTREPGRIGDYPKLAVTVRPVTRAKLNTAAATIEDRPTSGGSWMTASISTWNG